jgi:hypothetical protein
MSNSLERYKSDPFIPNAIRNQLVGFLEQRLANSQEALRIACERYFEYLRKEDNWRDLDKNLNWMSNVINKEMYDRGCGISQVQNRVNSIRDSIQAYYAEFNPISPSIRGGGPLPVKWLAWLRP